MENLLYGSISKDCIPQGSLWWKSCIKTKEVQKKQHFDTDTFSVFLVVKHS